MTEIVYGQRPPNFDAILAVFPMAANPGVVFAYGHQIFVPSGNPLPPELIDHEEVHCARRLALKNIAHKLSSRLYGGMVSMDQAKKAIEA